MAGITLEELRSEVLSQLGDAPEGEPMDALTAALVRFATLASVTTLDTVGTAAAVEQALDAGASAPQLQEVLVLISGVGMHTLIGTSTLLAEAVRRRDGSALEDELAPDVAGMAEELVGAGGREARVAAVAPDFWPNLLRLSPPGTVRAIAEFRAAPWAGEHLAVAQRELIGIAVDAMPSHRFLPTLLMHVRQAVAVGLGRAAVVQVLDLAAAAPPHPGVR